MFSDTGIAEANVSLHNTVYGFRPRISGSRFLNILAFIVMIFDNMNLVHQNIF